MIIKTYGENHNYLLFIDLEFNKQELVQFAGLLFKKIDKETYQLFKSINQYVATQVCYPFMEYTSITNNFLKENGVPKKDVISIIEEEFLQGIPKNELIVISHGLKNDRIVLASNGLNLMSFNGNPIDGYCTFTNARKILNRDKKLTLKDIAENCGYYMFNAHNAYSDVWAEVAVYTFLRKIEQQQKEELRKEE